MGRKRIACVAALVLLPVLFFASGVRAQGRGAFLVVHGHPDATGHPPEVRVGVSVIDASSARSIERLTPADLLVQEAERKVTRLQLDYEPVGLAVAVVVNRGGISAPGDERIGQAATLARHLIDRLSVTESDADDIVAVVGVAKGGTLRPTAGFSWRPVDLNLARNALMAMETEEIAGPTPLREGIDEALGLLAENPDQALREILALRRKVIVLFSGDASPGDGAADWLRDAARRAAADDISIYAIGMAQAGGSLRAETRDTLQHLGDETRGLYLEHSADDTGQRVLELFDSIATQRHQYVLSYNTWRPRGDYPLSLEARTDAGSAQGSAILTSVLDTPLLTLTDPTPRWTVTVPYSTALGGFETTTVPLSVRVTATDGVPREPEQVLYSANGEHIGTGTAAPGYPLEWDVSALVTPTAKVQTLEFALVAYAQDAYLGSAMSSPAKRLLITWEGGATGAPASDDSLLARTRDYLGGRWWWMAIPLGLVIVLGGLVVLGRRGVLQLPLRLPGIAKKETKHLASSLEGALAKLVVVKGTRRGDELALTGQAVSVGRDPRFSDIALHDDFTSNPHFSIQTEQGRFYIVDEHSRNGTLVDGRQVRAYEKVELGADALIDVGQTQLRFELIRVPPAHGEKTAPAGYEPPQVGEETAPVGYETVQAGREVAPVGYETGKVGEEPSPVGYETVKVGEEPPPVGYEAVQAGESPDLDSVDIHSESPSEPEPGEPTQRVSP